MSTPDNSAAAAEAGRATIVPAATSSATPQPEGVYVPPKRTLMGARFSRRGCKCRVENPARFLVWLLIFVILFVVACFLIADLALHRVDTDDALRYKRTGMTIAGIFFVLISFIMTGIQIYQHRKHYLHPASQRYIIRILINVPVATFLAWVSIAATKYGVYMDFLRVCYQAFVMYSFLLLLTQYMAGHKGLLAIVRSKPPIRWPIPWCCCGRVAPGPTLLYVLKNGAMQFVFVAPALSFVAIVTNYFGVYGENNFDRHFAYGYILFLVAFSEYWAMYCLVWLYKVLKVELKGYKLIPKLTLIAFTCFWPWWQSTIVRLFAAMGGFKGQDIVNAEELAMVQDLLIVIEMTIVGFVQYYVFSHHHYITGDLRNLLVGGSGVREEGVTQVVGAGATGPSAAPMSFRAPDRGEDVILFEGGMSHLDFGRHFSRALIGMVTRSPEGQRQMNKDGTNTRAKTRRDDDDEEDDAEVLGQDFVRSDQFNTEPVQATPDILNEKVTVSKKPPVTHNTVNKIRARGGESGSD